MPGGKRLRFTNAAGDRDAQGCLFPGPLPSAMHAEGFAMMAALELVSRICIRDNVPLPPHISMP